MARLILELKDRDAEDARFPCPLPDCKYGRHNTLWTVTRRPVTTWGHFVVFRLNGKEIVYDPTLPHEVDRIPRDAVKVEFVTAALAWHSDGHYFSL
jgi:hypothetical protein